MPSKLKQIENARGRPMPEILRELYARHGSQVEIARELGVSQSTVSLWLMRFGLREKKILVERRTVGWEHEH